MLKKIIRLIDKKLKFNQTIHKVSNLERSQTKIQRQVFEISWGLTFNNAIANSTWFLNKSVNPGRWAAGYPFLYILYRIYNDIKPKNILEFGLGESTKLSYQYINAHSESTLTVIEQDKEWLSFFSKEIFDIKNYTLLLNIKMTDINGYQANVYDKFFDVLPNQKFDFICIDGPWGSEHFSRYQIVQIAQKNILDDDFIILLDDYERNGEKETVEELRKVLKSQGKSIWEGVYSGENDSILICSEKYKFLTSL